MISRPKSEQLFAEALKYIPGGVNSPVRAFRAVGGQPFFVNRAQGAHIFDVDGNEYKRRQAAPGLKVTSKAFGVGRRIPIAQKYQIT